MTSKIGPKEAALREQRQTRSRRPKGHVRLAHMVEDFPKAVRESLKEHEKQTDNVTAIPDSELFGDDLAKAAKAEADAANERIAAKAKEEDVKLPDDGSIPEFLQRTETPEQADARRARNKKPDVSTGVTLAPDLGIQKAIARDLADEHELPKPKSKKAKSLLSAAMTGEVSMADALSAIDRLPGGAFGSAKSKKPKHSAEAKSDSESTMSKAKKTKSKANGSGKKSKVQIVADLLKRKEGCTTADVLKATGWPSVSMPAQAKAAGLRLKKEKDGSVTRYRAA